LYFSNIYGLIYNNFPFFFSARFLIFGFGFLKAVPLASSTNFLLTGLDGCDSLQFSLRFGVSSVLVLDIGGNLVTVLELN
jgi:hypothetical protein